ATAIPDGMAILEETADRGRMVDREPMGIPARTARTAIPDEMAFPEQTAERERMGGRERTAIRGGTEIQVAMATRDGTETQVAMEIRGVMGILDATAILDAMAIPVPTAIRRRSADSSSKCRRSRALGTRSSRPASSVA